MSRIRAVEKIALAAAVVLLSALPARAQASRTWVSGVGDDANPCSRTAPCKTFAGTISKTAAGGEIDALDPGGFGAVTITKSITIDGGGSLAAILANGTNGIIISIPSTAVVVLRNLSLNGFGTGIDGIRNFSAGTVIVEDCTIENFGASGKGINFAPSGGGLLFVRNTTLKNNAGGAISIGNARVSIEQTTATGNNFGVLAYTGSIVTVKNSFVAGGNWGFAAAGAASAVINIDSSVATNTNSGIYVANGATARIANSGILSNAVWGLQNDGSSFIVSLGGNHLIGNATDGSFTSTVGAQ